MRRLTAHDLVLLEIVNTGNCITNIYPCSLCPIHSVCVGDDPIDILCKTRNIKAKELLSQRFTSEELLEILI